MPDWTDHEIGELRRMSAAGHTSSYMGQCLGKSRGSIMGKCHRLKITLKSREKPAPWSETDAKTCRQMARNGDKSSMIGLALGRKCWDVLKYCKENDIQLRGRKRKTQEQIADAKLIAIRKREEKIKEARIVLTAIAHNNTQPAPQPPTGHSLLGAGPRECRFILGEPKAAIICGLPSTCGSAYCVEHTRRVIGGH